MTFIILEKSRLPPSAQKAPLPTPVNGNPKSVLSMVDINASPEICPAEVGAMIGDINFYLIPDQGEVSSGQHEERFEGWFLLFSVVIKTRTSDH